MQLNEHTQKFDIDVHRFLVWIPNFPSKTNILRNGIHRILICLFVVYMQAIKGMLLSKYNFKNRYIR